jgi:hypothetical protein
MFPSINRVNDTCAYLLNNQNRRNWLDCVDNHIRRKHSTLDQLNAWMRENPAEALRDEQGYGVLSYFTLESWPRVNFYISYALNHPDSVHQAGHRDRVLVYRDVGEVVGMARTQSPPPPNMAHHFQLTGVVVVIDVTAGAIITAFPSPQPSKPVIQ